MITSSTTLSSLYLLLSSLSTSIHASTFFKRAVGSTKSLIPKPSFALGKFQSINAYSRNAIRSAHLRYHEKDCLESFSIQKPKIFHDTYSNTLEEDYSNIGVFEMSDDGHEILTMDDLRDIMDTNEISREPQVRDPIEWEKEVRVEKLGESKPKSKKMTSRQWREKRNFISKSSNSNGLSKASIAELYPPPEPPLQSSAQAPIDGDDSDGDNDDPQKSKNPKKPKNMGK